MTAPCEGHASLVDPLDLKDGVALLSVAFAILPIRFPSMEFRLHLAEAREPNAVIDAEEQEHCFAPFESCFEIAHGKLVFKGGPD